MLYAPTLALLFLLFHILPTNYICARGQLRPLTVFPSLLWQLVSQASRYGAPLTDDETSNSSVREEEVGHWVYDNFSFFSVSFRGLTFGVEDICVNKHFGTGFSAQETEWSQRLWRELIIRWMSYCLFVDLWPRRNSVWRVNSITWYP